MELVIKRAFDVMAAALLLLVLSPLLLVVSVLVRVKLGSPIFFRQTRIGKDEQPFTIIKFRTMREGTGSDAERLTPFGHWLRASSVDELPELWNILKGDMSFVGPRPLLPEYLPYYREDEKIRHTVRPGLTGLAQINGRNALDWDSKLRYDAEYVKNFSLARDRDILLRTYMSVLKREGISAEGHATFERLDKVRSL